jgi:hypothetical protein
MCSLGGDHVSASQLDLGAVRDGQTSEAAAGDNRAQGAQGGRSQGVPEPIDPMAALLDRYALDLDGALGPIECGEAFKVAVRGLFPFVRDLRNRAQDLERRVAELEGHIALRSAMQTPVGLQKVRRRTV